MRDRWIADLTGTVEFDADAVERWDAWMDRLGKVLGPMVTEIPPKIGSRKPADLGLVAALNAQAAKSPLPVTVDADGIGGQGLVGFQRTTVTREDVADPPLRDRHQRLNVQPVLEREEEVQAAAQQAFPTKPFTLIVPAKADQSPVIELR